MSSLEDFITTINGRIVSPKLKTIICVSQEVLGGHRTHITSARDRFIKNVLC